MPFSIMLDEEEILDFITVFYDFIQIFCCEFSLNNDEEYLVKKL